MEDGGKKKKTLFGRKKKKQEKNIAISSPHEGSFRKGVHIEQEEDGSLKVKKKNSFTSFFSFSL